MTPEEDPHVRLIMIRVEVEDLVDQPPPVALLLLRWLFS